MITPSFADRSARFLLVRHPTYQTHAFDIVLWWLKANVPQVLSDFEPFWLGDENPPNESYDLCIPWLQDPIQNWCTESYQQAVRLTEWCDSRQIPVVNRPERLINATKTEASRRIRTAGVRAPQMARIHDAAEFRKTCLGIPLPLIVREDWGHGGPIVLLRSSAEVADFCLDQFRRPIAVEWVDTRRDGLYRKYRYLATGETGVSHHLQFSKDWITRGGCRATPRSRQEELNYVSRPDPNAKSLQGVRQALQLDMVAFDYGYDRSGGLIIWEANPFPFIQFSRLDRKYRNFALHESLRAIVSMYYRMTAKPIPRELRNLRRFRVPFGPRSWRRRWHRLRESLGHYRRSITTALN